MSKNVEFGVLASPTSDGGCRMVSAATAFIDQLIRRARSSKRALAPGRVA
jgi:hypothetical protein